MNLSVYSTKKMSAMHATTPTKKHSKIKKNEGGEGPFYVEHFLVKFVAIFVF